ncbi:hypothetical protein D9M68_798160 [compost metagenome]
MILDLRTVLFIKVGITQYTTATVILFEQFRKDKWLNGRTRLDVSRRGVVLTISLVIEIAATNQRNNLPSLRIFDGCCAISEAIACWYIRIEHISHGFLQFILDTDIERGFNH